VTADAERARTLVRALRARVDGDTDAIRMLYTDDVTAWTPSLAVSSAEELAREFERSDDAFSDIELEVSPLDVGGDYACAEWRVTMTHSGPLQAGDQVVDASGTRVALHGVTVAEFRGERICALRQYWDELSLFEQLGLLSPTE
jgi:ketosteroid isomerase-like protein